jgi:hypothetical protein
MASKSWRKGGAGRIPPSGIENERNGGGGGGGSPPGVEFRVDMGGEPPPHDVELEVRGGASAVKIGLNNGGGGHVPPPGVEIERNGGRGPAPLPLHGFRKR